jgi:hypothetical protein
LKKPFWSAVLALIVLLVLAADMAGAKEMKSALKPFFGHYVGGSTSVVGEGLGRRDFTIDIEPYMEIGFTMKWITLIRYTARKPKTKRHKVSFLPYRKRPGIFYSVIKKNVFGNVTSSDPLTGEPYVWAALKGNTLTMNALYITDNGGYELQSFKRTLEDKGLNTHFERIRDGKRLRLITGRLERVPN